MVDQNTFDDLYMRAQALAAALRIAYKHMPKVHKVRGQHKWQCPHCCAETVIDPDDLRHNANCPLSQVEHIYYGSGL